MSDTNDTRAVQFVNNFDKDDTAWQAHINILNGWTAPELQLRMIISYIRSGPHFPKHMHQDLIEQWHKAALNRVIGEDISPIDVDITFPQGMPASDQIMICDAVNNKLGQQRERAGL